MYRSSAIVKQWMDRQGTSLKTEEDCRMAMVWIALLGGGDYAPEGLTGFGEFFDLKWIQGTQSIVYMRRHVDVCVGVFSISRYSLARGQVWTTWNWGTQDVVYVRRGMNLYWFRVFYIFFGVLDAHWFKKLSSHQRDGNPS